MWTTRIRRRTADTRGRIRRWLLCSTLVLPSVACLAAPPGDISFVAKLSSLQTTYKMSDEIVLEFTTQSEKARFFTCAVERLEPDGWYMLIPSVELKERSMVVRLVPVKPGERKTIRWRPEEHRPGFGVGPATYRFRVGLLASGDADSPGGSTTSTAFQVREGATE